MDGRDKKKFTRRTVIHASVPSTKAQIDTIFVNM